jgi:hypothetical protein
MVSNKSNKGVSSQRFQDLCLLVMHKTKHLSPGSVRYFPLTHSCPRLGHQSSKGPDSGKLAGILIRQCTYELKIGTHI